GYFGLIMTAALFLAMSLHAQNAVMTDAQAASGAPAETGIPPTATLENLTAPTYSDINCAGYVTSDVPSDRVFVAGGWDRPHDTKFADREYVYLTGGNLQVGNLYKIVRHLQDPNAWEAFKGARNAIAAVGQPYAEIAHVRVVAIRGQNIGIAMVEFSCEPTV